MWSFIYIFTFAKHCVNDFITIQAWSTLMQGRPPCLDFSQYLWLYDRAFTCYKKREYPFSEWTTLHTVALKRVIWTSCKGRQHGNHMIVSHGDGLSYLHPKRIGHHKRMALYIYLYMEIVTAKSMNHCWCVNLELFLHEWLHNRCRNQCKIVYFSMNCCNNMV